MACHPLQNATPSCSVAPHSSHLVAPGPTHFQAASPSLRPNPIPDDALQLLPDFAFASDLRALDLHPSTRAALALTSSARDDNTNATTYALHIYIDASALDDAGAWPNVLLVQDLTIYNGAFYLMSIVAARFPSEQLMLAGSSDCTNNLAQLTAILNAVPYAARSSAHRMVHVYTDSNLYTTPLNNQAAPRIAHALIGITYIVARALAPRLSVMMAVLGTNSQTHGYQSS